MSEFNGAWRVDSQRVPTGSIMIGSRKFQSLLFTKLVFESASGARDHTAQKSRNSDFFSLTFAPSQPLSMRCNGTEFQLAQNQMLFWSSRDDVSFEVEQGCDFANLLFPKRVLEDHLPNFDSSFHRFDKDCASRNLAEAYFTSLAENASMLTDSDESHIETAATSMLLNLLHTHGRLNYSNEKRISTLNDALRIIDRNLKCFDLTPHFIASHLGISVRKLHYLFRGSDYSVMATIRKKRLQKAREDLSNPAAIDHLSITHIAYRWAFSDPAQFCSAFKSEFGESPKRFRQKLMSQSRDLLTP
ncbi:MAG: helix-turn-helix domain-containing protein [Pseudomonadota bacterium]